MGTYYTVACRPCRKFVSLHKLGRDLRAHAIKVDGEPAPVLTHAGVVEGLYCDCGLCEYVPLAEWVKAHSEHGPVLLLNDDDGSDGLVHDDPVPWGEVDIDDLCPR